MPLVTSTWNVGCCDAKHISSHDGWRHFLIKRSDVTMCDLLAGSCVEVVHVELEGAERQNRQQIERQQRFPVTRHARMSDMASGLVNVGQRVRKRTKEKNSVQWRGGGASKGPTKCQACRHDEHHCCAHVQQHSASRSGVEQVRRAAGWALPGLFIHFLKKERNLVRTKAKQVSRPGSVTRSSTLACARCARRAPRRSVLALKSINHVHEMGVHF